MQNSRDHVSCAQHLEVTYTLKKFKNSPLFDSLNVAFVILMPICLQLVNKVKMERMLVFMRNQYFERNKCFAMASCKVL